MADTSIRIDKDLRPAYYDDFHCLAEGCKISCCKNWRIYFNKKDYLSLKRQEGSAELNALLEGSVRRIRKGQTSEVTYGEFDMDNGVCPLLGEDCLCCLQKEKGHAALPHVCRTYPRAEKYMPSGCLDRSLSPSCEGVLTLLWDLSEGIEFRSDPLPKERHRKRTLKEDNPMLLWFSVVREWCIDILQNRRFTLPQRIFLMGLGLKELADGEENIERWMERAAVLPSSVDMESVLPSGDAELSMYLTNCVYTLMKLPIKDPNGGPGRAELLKGLELKANKSAGNLTISLDAYRAARTRYEEQFGQQDYFMENLMASIFFHLHMPHMGSREELWKSYVSFCNLYAVYRLLAVMSCREGAAGDREELFRLMVFASRGLIHDNQRQNRLRDELFKNDSATLAHMAILLCG